MKRISLFAFVCITLITSCNQSNKSDSVDQPNASAEFKKPIIVVHRAKLSYKEIGKPSLVKASAPAIFNTNTNLAAVNELTEITAEKDLYTIAPGDDSMQRLKPIIVAPKKVVCKPPIPQKALSPRFKDAAISDIQYLDVDQGLSSSMLKCVINDKSGNIWIGTNGAGVSKYDGENFINYTQKNGLSNNTILTLFEDSKGRIWFGTEGGGACWFDGTFFYSLTTEQGLGDNTVLTITEDRSGRIWIGTNGGGAFCFDEKTLTAYTEKEGLNNNMVRCILEDRQGNIWFGTTGSGACKYNGKEFVYFGERAGLNSSIVHTIVEDKNGVIYFGTEDGGVNVYDGEKVRYITKKRGLSSDCIVSLLIDKNNVLWIGTYDKGLCYYNNNEIGIYTIEQGLTNDYILGISLDKSNNIWMATYGGGLCKFNTTSFSHYTKNEGFVNNTVRSMAIDNSNNIVFGTFGDGLVYYNGKTFNHYTEKEGLPSNRIMTVLSDNDNIWIGTEQNGIAKFNGKNFEYYTTEQGLSSDYIKCSLKSKNGIVWFGTDEGGLFGISNNQIISFIDEEELNTGIVTGMVEDNNGSLWIATQGSGVCCFDGSYLKWYNTKSGLSDNAINCITKDKEGNIWLGGNSKGISILDSKTLNTSNPKITCLDVKDNLSNTSIKSIIQDKNSNVWVSTEFGLNLITKKNAKRQIISYTTSEGLKANNFMKNSVVLDSTNVLWWGNGKALTKLDLNKFEVPNSKPIVHITGIELEKTFVDFYKLNDSSINKSQTLIGIEKKKNLKSIRFDSVVNFYNYPTSLNLPHNINQLDFTFNAIEWGASEKLKYQYKLIGADQDWSPLTEDNKAFYNNLPNGDYSFKLRAVGISGNLSDEINYTFYIRPPWYKTVWAYCFYFIGFISIIIGFNNIRTRQLKIKQAELEAIVEERTAEIVEQKELIEEKQKEIVDSINYAKRIQKAILTSDQFFAKYLKNYFVLFEPKDIVSGDFYWASNLSDERLVLVTADSTGHGVPGAMMSMLNISCLNEAVNERKIYQAAEILNYARQRIITSLSEDGSEEGGKDGMDCSAVVFDFKNYQLNYAAANNPIWIIRRNKENAENKIELIELKPDRMPVGRHIKDSIPFTNYLFKLQSDDLVLTLTDGFADQFGGSRQKKYTYKRLKELLLNLYELSPQQQKENLTNSFKEWKGKIEQVDDVLLIGVRVL
ncbi:MAG: SpoIIE family protein phosphatase [Bacteroidetes bacterium]|nr:SpoIIE family protein phosphatase [Bacteroidota bacterium]MCA6442818.1 SpoIIE family protein phosphatase [Bacteroidota bacterium]